MLDQNLTVITGTYGTGKTYYIVRDAYEAYLAGAIVISNMWLAFPHIRWYLPEDLPKILHEIYDYHEDVIVPFEAPDSYLLAHDIKRNRDTPPRNFYILADEGGVFFNSRNFQTNFKEKSLLVMLAEPRHFNMQIVAITQKLDLIDKTFRDLAQEIIEFKPFLFGLFRQALSYDTKRINDEVNWEEMEIIESKTYFHWWHRYKDTHSFFGGLYFTKEVLGDLALRRKDDITSLLDFFEKEDAERDWRESFVKKVFNRAIELQISDKVIKNSKRLQKFFEKEEIKRMKYVDDLNSKEDELSQSDLIEELGDVVYYIPEKTEQILQPDNPIGFKKKMISN